MKDLHCGKTRCAHFNRLKKKKKKGLLCTLDLFNTEKRGPAAPPLFLLKRSFLIFSSV